MGKVSGIDDRRSYGAHSFHSVRNATRRLVFILWFVEPSLLFLWSKAILSHDASYELDVPAYDQRYPPLTVVWILSHGRENILEILFVFLCLFGRKIQSGPSNAKLLGHHSFTDPWVVLDHLTSE